MMNVVEGYPVLNILNNSRDDARADAMLQPHGVSLGLSQEPPSAVILAASPAIQSWWGEDPEDVIGEPLSRFVDLTTIESSEWSRLSERPRIGPYRLKDRGGNTLYASFTHCDGQHMAHLERPDGTAPKDGDELLKVSRYSERIQASDDISQLWAMGSEVLRSWLGFDRTLIIRMNSNEGEVVAEAVRPGLPSVADAVLELPATEQPFGVSETAPLLAVYDINAESVSLNPDGDSLGWTWNLNHSPLRPAPLTLRRAMIALSARSSYSILVGDEHTRYLILSTSAEPRRVDAFCRVRTSMLAQLAFSRTRTLQRRKEAQRRLHGLECRDALAIRLRKHSNILDAVLPSRDDPFDVLDLVRADAVVFSSGGECRAVGGVSPLEERAILRSGKRWAKALQGRRVLRTDDVRHADPQLYEEAPSIAGILTTAIGGEDGFISWIRRSEDRCLLRMRLDEELPDEMILAADRASRRSEPWTELDEQDAGRAVQAIEDQMLRGAEAKLAELALVDPLTQLPNRRLLRERVGQALKRRERGRSFVLAFIDLNDFKLMNDTHGHRFGDDLLIAVGERLQASVRASDTVARLGGDEFVALFEDVLPEERSAILERLAECFAEPFLVHSEELVLHAAIGAAEAKDGDSVESLLERADVEMYEAKALMKAV